MEAKTIRKKAVTLLWISFATGIFFFTFFSADKSLNNLLMNFAVCSLYTLTLSLGNALLNDWLDSKYSWIEDTRMRLVLGIFATLLVNTVLVFLCGYVNFILLQNRDASLFFSGSIASFNWIGINIALLISAVLHAKGFMQEWKKTSKREIIEQKVIASSANSQFETLKNQLDPHFLFNSLNVLSALIDENPAQAQIFTASMSKIYRYILEQKDKELVSVEEELDFAKTYTALLKTRFEDSVHFKFEVSEKDKKLFVVPLSLQLLIENCIKHNFATPAKPLSIKIYSKEGMLHIENNFQARDSGKEAAGIGLANIVQRYNLLTQRNVFIEKDPSFFKVKIPILKEKVTLLSNSSTSEEQLAYQYAIAKVKALKKFYSNLASFSIVIPFLFLINYLSSPDYIWAVWPLLGWAVGLTFQALKTFGVGSDWENKEVRKILAKENLHYNKLKNVPNEKL